MLSVECILCHMPAFPLQTNVCVQGRNNSMWVSMMCDIKSCALFSLQVCTEESQVIALDKSATAPLFTVHAHNGAITGEWSLLLF